MISMGNRFALRAAVLAICGLLASCQQEAPVRSDPANTDPVAAEGTADETLGDRVGSPAPVPTEVTTPTAEPRLPEPVKMTGNEPFWGGEGRAEELHYNTLENPKGWTVQSALKPVGQGWRWDARIDGKPITADVAKVDHCSDTMSDYTYPFRVVVKFDGQELRGCGWTQSMPYKEDAHPDR